MVWLLTVPVPWSQTGKWVRTTSSSELLPERY